MKYKHIVFDVDGTLIDSRYAMLHSLQDALKEVTGSDYSEQELLFSLGIPGLETMVRMGVPDPEAGLHAWERAACNYIDHLLPFEQMETLLRALLDRGLSVGLVTSKTHGEMADQFDHLSISPLLNKRVCVDDTEKHKPDPDPLLCYMRREGLSPDELLYTGDSRYDMLCAQGAGVDFVLAGWGAPESLIAEVGACPMSPLEMLNYIR